MMYKKLNIWKLFVFLVIGTTIVSCSKDDDFLDIQPEQGAEYRLIINADTSDYELQREVMEVYGERYPDMRIIDWQRIIADYTPMVREAAQKPTANIIEMQQRQYGMAAEPENNHYPEQE